MFAKKVVPYYRVSTQRQGRSGLGLEAQEYNVSRFISFHQLEAIKSFTEIRSTRKTRPQLEEALQFCKVNNLTLIVATLDRLGRDVEEIARIVKSGVEIIVVDNPHANRFTIHILAAVAEEQRRTISVNTKGALQAAKKRGIKLGKYGASILSKQNKQNASEWALEMRPIITELQAEGIKTIRGLTAELNKRNVPTYRGTGRWQLCSVHSLLKRNKQNPVI